MRTLAELPEIDPFSPEFLEDPIGAFEAARERSWAMRSVRGLEVLSYDGVVGSYVGEAFVAGVPRMIEMMGLDIDRIAGPGDSLLTSEGADHKRLRGVVSKWFTPRRVQQLRADVEQLVTELITPMTVAGGGDVVAEMTRRLPGPVFCWMIGAPEDRGDELFAMSEILLQAFTGDPGLADAITEQSGAMTAFVDELVEAKRREPGDDLMTILIGAADAGTITMDDVHSLAFEMLTASTDNTANSAGVAIALLADRQDQWELVRQDAALVPGAVEECGRYDPVVRGGVQRTAEDTVLLDLEIPADTMVWPSMLSAHYDPTAYPDPHRFDVTRVHERPQLNFGVGRHYCLGAALARMELQAVLTVLRSRWAGFEPDGDPDIDRAFGAKVNAVPLEVTPAA